MGKIKERELQLRDEMIHDIWELFKSKIPFTDLMCVHCLQTIEFEFKKPLNNLPMDAVTRQFVEAGFDWVEKQW